MKNKLVKFALLEAGMKQWELAELLGMSESALSRRLRDELPEEEQKRIIAIIENAGGGLHDK